MKYWLTLFFACGLVGDIAAVWRVIEGDFQQATFLAVVGLSLWIKANSLRSV